MFKLSHVIIAVATVALSSCSDSNSWEIKGKIVNADGNTLRLEASTNGRWYTLDSTKIKSDGTFTIKEKPSGYPDIYRLRLNDRIVYFPIDSTETVTITADARKFDSEYVLSGSTAAEMLMAIDRRIASSINSTGVSAITNDSILKRELSGMLLGDPAGIASYYIINKRINGAPIFNPENKHDIRIIGAVANAFNEYRPNDPRTRYLTNLFLSHRQMTSNDTLFAEEIHLIDIDLYDNSGMRRNLISTADSNAVVVLNFTAYSADFSPALNVTLNNIYEQYRNRGLEIYQVAFDDNEYQWRQSARNLPWITVYNSSSDGAENLIKYNVGALPATFIIKNGQLMERVEKSSKIESTISKYI